MVTNRGGKRKGRSKRKNGRTMFVVETAFETVPETCSFTERERKLWCTEGGRKEKGGGGGSLWASTDLLPH